jgi:hypothetical protein
MGVAIDYVIETLFRDDAYESTQLLTTQQANAIEEVAALKAGIEVIHHPSFFDGEDGDCGGVPETRGNLLAEPGHRDPQ